MLSLLNAPSPFFLRLWPFIIGWWILVYLCSFLNTIKRGTWEEKGKEGKNFSDINVLNYVYFLKSNMTQESKLNLTLLILNLQVQVGIHSTLQKCFPTVDKLLTFCSYFVLNGHLLRKCSMASVLTACVNTSFNKP